MVGQGSSRQPSSDASDHVKMTIDDSGNPIDHLEAAAGKEGYLLDTSHARSGDLKTTQDGRTILIPQPSASPLDPLNWSWARKHLILIIVSMTAFLPDYGSATGAVTLLPQSAIWKMTPDEVNHSQVGNVFMLGAGGVFVVALAAYFGRYPVFFWFAIIATATAVWCTAAQTFESFMDSQWLLFHSGSRDAACAPIIICKPPVFISMVYYLLTFAWVVEINTTLSIFLGPLYNFGPKQIGFFYFTPVTAAILGEIAGHWLHDLIARTAARRNNGRLEPESRYVATWIATPFMFAGLILLGFALEREYHYMLASLGWGLYVFGIMITTVAVNAYVLDSYPEASGEVAAWINFGRTTGGFVVSYFMVRWAHEQGTIRQFGTMTGICGFAFLMVLGLQIFGKRMRLWAGPAKFKTV
ncbi:conserved hypothetical protein [Histoplasma mississippiense (nom. inval.)]|uniref:conserved hypothetical protein n=1 Tax=Ajellomyces capsulatus (strain NAm1 / WU24) TaxID=2059318 RepID=UPI000157B4CB|nr:conserved hypothetical protein [Histoplasma mississippiense (nom. inval.)]EDN02799.1 conserved hypothetical protein [Histoplasma mississippiense (nom. inval.)]